MFLSDFGQVIAHVLVRFALGRQRQVLRDQPPPALQQEGDLPGLQAPIRQIRTPRERREIVAHRFGTMTHDAADLGGRLAFQRQANDLGAVGQDRTDIVYGAPQRNHRFGIGRSQRTQVAADRAGRDEEDPVGQILRRQQAALAEGLLTERRNPGATKAGRPLLVEQPIIVPAAMNDQTKAAFAALANRFAGALVGIGRHDADAARCRARLSASAEG